MRPLSECAVTIVGLGLMGGSLAGALQGQCGHVIGVDRDAHALACALERRFVDQATADLGAAARKADIVVLATPVRSIIQLVGQVGEWMKPGSLLMDLGSTKGLILAAMAQLPDHVQPLGGHPMCGKEISGHEAAERELFDGCTFILSPLARTSDEALALGKALVESVGAQPLVIEGGRQDYLVGTISHLPYLLACSLVSTADATTSADPLVWRILAGGYRDTSRVAGSDVTMMVDILMTNREEVVKAARVCGEQLAYLADLVDRGDEDLLREKLTYIRKTRREHYP
ncbi:MAG: prephenate dehydrogenase [Anaerolineae bacterium]|nr:prephenate dehydrogenase [Anaerolineae bacterium]